MTKPLPGALLLALISGLVAVAQATAAPPADIVASFDYAPASPLTGQVVAFASTSTATGQNNQVTFQVWDLDNDGRFNDASGTTAARWFSAAGVYTISLRAYDSHGHSSVATRSITVSDPPPPPPQVLTPFPTVRMSGKVTRRGTRLGHLSVEAPDGATVTLRCRGRGCPLRKQVRTAAVDFKATANGSRVIRFHRFDDRLFRKGAVIKVFVTRSGTIGKYVRFKMRHRKPPLRTDRCVGADTTVPVSCPLS
jgi:hypothetical protein